MASVTIAAAAALPAAAAVLVLPGFGVKALFDAARTWPETGDEMPAGFGTFPNGPKSSSSRSP